MATSKSQTTTTSKTAGAKTPLTSKPQALTGDAAFAFGRENYVIMLVGLVFIMVGFMLMSGGKSTDPNVFNDAIFSFRRITLAPIVVLIGYGIEIYAIVKKAK